MDVTKGNITRFQDSTLIVFKKIPQCDYFLNLVPYCNLIALHSGGWWEEGNLNQSSKSWLLLSVKVQYIHTYLLLLFDHVITAVIPYKVLGIRSHTAVHRPTLVVSELKDL